MKKLSKLSILLLSIALASCGTKIKPYNPSSDNKPESFNFTAKEVVSKLSNDFTLKETNSINGSKEFTLVNKYSPSYKIVLSAKDINSKVQVISVDNYLNNETVDEFTKEIKNQQSHELTSVQFDRVKKNISFLSCSNENHFLETGFICDGSYKVEDRSNLVGVKVGGMYTGWAILIPFNVLALSYPSQVGEKHSVIAILPLASN